MIGFCPNSFLSPPFISCKQDPLCFRVKECLGLFSYDLGAFNSEVRNSGMFGSQVNPHPLRSQRLKIPLSRKQPQAGLAFREQPPSLEAVVCLGLRHIPNILLAGHWLEAGVPGVKHKYAAGFFSLGQPDTSRLLMASFRPHGLTFGSAGHRLPSAGPILSRAGGG